MPEINFDDIAYTIQHGRHNLVAMTPDGRERVYGYYLPNYQNVLALIRPAINEDLRNEGADEDFIRDFILPIDESRPHPFIDKVAAAINKAAQKGRFK